jgi:hypothetical protein
MSNVLRDIEAVLFKTAVILYLRKKGYKALANSVATVAVSDVVALLSGQPVDIDVKVQEGDVKVLGKTLAASGDVLVHLQLK